MDDGAQERRPQRRLYIHKMTSREGTRLEWTPEGSGTLTLCPRMIMGKEALPPPGHLPSPRRQWTPRGERKLEGTQAASSRACREVHTGGTPKGEILTGGFPGKVFTNTRTSKAFRWLKQRQQQPRITIVQQQQQLIQRGYRRYLSLARSREHSNERYRA